ncbi:MAG: DUF3854 domain-containing protein [Hassallia sp. WJT32-NPBG1]|jgi:DNA polymerase I-like protein with 3'-5' exonuclease and polymerase domains|nr:DUF3854 domain-containing protein [Hassallia sp. WJT32-NPBG1]
MALLISKKKEKLEPLVIFNNTASIGINARLDSHDLNILIRKGIHPGLIRENYYTAFTFDEKREALGITHLSVGETRRQYNVVMQDDNPMLVCGDQCKPRNPRRTRKRGTYIYHKYESKPKTPTNPETKPYYHVVPDDLAQQILNNFGVEFTPGDDFWLLVRNNPQVPVIITEGVMKAGSVMSISLTPAIALPGHNTACHKDNGDVRFPQYLHPDRKIIAIFDNDPTYNVSFAVDQTITRLKFKLAPKDEEIRAQLFVARWFTRDKGIDDLFEKYGAERIIKVVNEAVSVKQWVSQTFNKLGFVPNVEFNSKWWVFQQIPDASEYPLVCILGAKGTGKTKQFEIIVQELKKTITGVKILFLIHRVELGKSICNRVGIPYIDDLKSIDKVNELGLCFHSILKLNPDDWRGAFIFMDEADQVFLETALGKLCLKDREKIIRHIKALFKAAIDFGGQVIIASADLNHPTISLASGFCGGVDPYIIENTYNEPSYPCFLSKGFTTLTESGRYIQTPADVIALALAMAKDGKRMIIHLTGQKVESIYGSINIEKLFLSHGIDSIIRIDSDTTKDPTHIAFQAGSRINQICDNYQIKLMTPTLETGVSIESINSEDTVFGVNLGVGSSNSCRQSLIRLRDKTVPRILYVAQKGLQTEFKSLGYTPNSVTNKLHELVELGFDTLDETDSDWNQGYDQILQHETLADFIAKTIAHSNVENTQFYYAVKEGLLKENVQLTECSDVTNLYPQYRLNPQNIYDELVESAEIGIKESNTKIVGNRVMSDEEYQLLKTATELTAQQKLDLITKSISRRYGGIEITQELLELDRLGYYNQIRLDYTIGVGAELQAKIHLNMGASQLKDGEGRLIETDFLQRQHNLYQAKFLIDIGLLEYIESNPTISKNDEETILMCQIIAENREAINQIFNLILKEEVDNNGFNLGWIKSLLNLIGREVSDVIRKKIKGKVVRLYNILPPDELRFKCFEKWLEFDAEYSKNWEKRKEEWAVEKLVTTINKGVTIAEFFENKQHPLFNKAWEKVTVQNRTALINQADGFEYKPSHKIFVDATDATRISEVFQTLNSMPAIAIDSETYGDDKPNKKRMRKEGLHKANGHIRLIQFSDAHLTITVDFGGRDSDTRQTALDNFKPHFQALLAKKDLTVIGHNLSFDNGFWKHTFNTQAYCQFSDTLLGFKTFFGIYNGDKFGKGGFALGTMVEQFLGVPMDKTEQKSDWGENLTKSQKEYAALDPHLNFLLWQRLNEIYDDPTKFGFAKIAKWDMREAWELENNCIEPLSEIEFNGLPISKEKIDSLMSKVDEETESLLTKWQKLAPTVAKPTQGKKLLIHLEQKYGLVLSKCDKKTLGNFIQHDEIKLRFQYMGLLNYRTRLIKLDKSIKRHGRAKTFFNPLTGTGRTSSGGQFDDIVNVQSIPAKLSPEFEDLGVPSLRKVFKVDEGLKLIVSDMAAAHARIANDFANDEIGKLAQNDDSIDAHSVFALLIAQSMPAKFLELGLPAKFLLSHEINLKLDWDAIETDYHRDKEKLVELVESGSIDKFILSDVTVEDKEILQAFKSACSSSSVCKALRDLAKNIFYAKLNGASVGRIKAELAGQMKIVATDVEAKLANDRFDSLYPQLAEYCKIAVNKLSDEEYQIQINNKIFGITEIADTGQRLLFELEEKHGGLKPKKPTEVIACQWSRTEATIMKRSLVIVSKILRKHPEWHAKLVNIVHDELNIEVPETHAPRVAKLVCWVMDREFKKVLKNGVKTGSPSFKNNHSIKYLLDDNGKELLDKKGKKIIDPKFKTSYHSLIGESWADK